MTKLPHQINVLYIEDDTDIVQVVSTQLKSSEHTRFNITAVNTIKDALEILTTKIKMEKLDLDIILLDLVLPNSKGIGTFKKIKQKCGDIPIVIISAHEDIACQCISLGAQDYLVKPDIPKGLLIRSIKYALHRHQLESNIKSIIKNSTLGYHIYELRSEKLILTGYNPAADNILKIDHSTLIGKEISQAFPNLDLDVKLNYIKAAKGISWKDQIIPYEDKDIAKAYFKICAYKTAKNTVAVSFEDITEKFKKDTLLKESEEKYRSFVEATGACMFGIDFSTYRITYANDAFAQTLGYSKEEALKLKMTDFLTQDGLLTFRSRVLDLKAGKFVSGMAEYESIRKDGSKIWVYVTIQFVEDDDGEIRTANCVAVDITDKKIEQLKKQIHEDEIYTKLEKEINEWKDEIAEKQQSRERALQLIDKQIISMKHKTVDISGA